jgi:hypothetical protein
MITNNVSSTSNYKKENDEIFPYHSDRVTYMAMGARSAKYFWLQSNSILEFKDEIFSVIEEVRQGKIVLYAILNVEKEKNIAITPVFYLDDIDEFEDEIKTSILIEETIMDLEPMQDVQEKVVVMSDEDKVLEEYSLSLYLDYLEQQQEQGLISEQKRAESEAFAVNYYREMLEKYYYKYKNA